MTRSLLIFLIPLSLFALEAESRDKMTQDFQCEPTVQDEMGPMYVPQAPQRNKVGTGYLLFGSVMSAVDCQPIIDAKIEIWMAGPEGHYGNDWRASLFSNNKGAYYLESHVPPYYGAGRPHIHIRATAAGFVPLVTQHYPREGAGIALFDLILIPDQ